MANCKQVEIRAIVPFDWVSQLTDEEAKVWAGWTIGPHGLVFSYGAAEGIQRPREGNRGGGYVTRYRLTLSGQEAFGTGALVTMVESLRRQEHAEVLIARYFDMDDNSGYFRIPTPDEYEQQKIAASAWVEEVTRGKVWVTTSLGGGITQSRLEPEGYVAKPGEKVN